MRIWIRAVCRQPVDFTGPEMAAGIGQRLNLLILLFCPDDEEPAADVMARLRVVPLEAGVWAIRWRTDDRFIRVESWRGAAARTEAREFQELLASTTGAGADAVRALLDSATEIVGFELKASDADGMGWPVAISAATWLATRGDGLIQAETEGWMAPTPKEIRIVLNEHRRG